MMSAARIESRCSRIAGSLDAQVRDDVAMLRTARMLKTIHADLKAVLWAQVRVHGHTTVTMRAQATLDRMEGDLRHVLIDYSSMRGIQVHQLLVHAVARSMEALTLLDA